MIVTHGYIGAMNENDEPCLELNEMIYRLTGEFWKQIYYFLLSRQKMYEPDFEVSVSQSIFELRKEIKNIAKENGLKYSAFSHNELFYISLIPYPIYIGIERETGDFSISAPHITTRHFSHSYYKAGLNWIRDYLAIDVKPLTEQIDSLREKFYLNSKSSEIVTVSIKALCDSILGKKLIPYELNQNRILSVILFQTPDKTAYELEIFHKPFSKDASLLIKLLNEPREIKIPDVLSCAPVHCYDDEISAMVENLKKKQEAFLC